MPHITEKDRNRIIAALTTVAALVAIGTYTMHYVEDWSWVDSFYFTTMTVTTVGHGDLYPTTDASKIIQSLLAFAGIMVVVYSMSVVGSIYFRQAESSIQSGRHHEVDMSGAKDKSFILPHKGWARKQR